MVRSASAVRSGKRSQLLGKMVGHGDGPLPYRGRRHVYRPEAKNHWLTGTARRIE